MNQPRSNDYLPFFIQKKNNHPKSVTHITHKMSYFIFALLSRVHTIAYHFTRTASYDNRPKTYEEKALQRTPFQILPNLELTPLTPTVAPADILLLERFADKISDRVWRLPKTKLFDVLESGTPLEEIQKWLFGFSSDKIIPDNVSHFLEDVGKKSRYLTPQGTWTLIECDSAPTAVQLTQDRDVQKYSRLSGDRHILIASGHEKAFQKKAKKLGFILILPKTRRC